MYKLIPLLAYNKFCTPRSKARTDNKLNPHETASTGIELGSQRWEASAYPLRHPCSKPAAILDFHVRETPHVMLLTLPFDWNALVHHNGVCCDVVDTNALTFTTSEKKLTRVVTDFNNRQTSEFLINTLL